MIQSDDDTRVIEPDAEAYNASLVKRVDLTDDLAYFWVKFDGEATPFESGQYMTTGVLTDGKMLQRPYSVASPPSVANSEGTSCSCAWCRSCASPRPCGGCRSATGCG